MGRIIIYGLFAKGRINKILREVAETTKASEEDEYLSKYYYAGYDWVRTKIYTLKTVDKIFFPEKKEILSELDAFNSSKSEYFRRGIEWYYGLLLHGKPGSGKSSFAKAVAKYLGRDLYTINLASVSDKEFTESFNDMGKNACLLLDDIDVGMQGRDDKENKSVTLSTILSCLDGSNSRSDLVVIMTTNHLEKLGEALIRAGRVDKIVEVSYPDKESVEEYLTNFYNEPIIIGNYKTTQMANIQNICLKNNKENAIKLIQN